MTIHSLAATINSRTSTNPWLFISPDADQADHPLPRRGPRPRRQGTNFVGLRDAGDPVEVARRYEEQGADELVFLDISASHEGRAIMLDMVRRVAEQIFMPFTVGGGIRTLDDATQLIQAGAEKVSINSAAVKTPELIAAGVPQVRPLRHRGEHRSRRRSAIVAIGREKSGKSTSTAAACRPGWKRSPGRKRVEELGAGEIVLTSMDADGTKNGYDLPMLEAVSRAVNIPVVASGGAGNPEHLRQAFEAGRRRRAGRQHLPLQRVLDPGHQGVPGRHAACRSDRQHRTAARAA